MCNRGLVVKMKSIRNRRRPGAVVTLLFALTMSSLLQASESDPWTYAYIPLDDSASIVNDRLSLTLNDVIGRVNEKHGAEMSGLDDRSVEFIFFAQFRERHIRDVAWGMFERCIGTNDCPGWPRLERIQMYPQESVYAEAGWRFIPSRFHLASIIEVCGVRMGADKLTHFFDDAFHYFNALRSRSKKLDPEDIRRLSMTFERTYMGTGMTGILSRADIEANLTGVRFYGEIFGSPRPIIGRAFDGRLVMLRSPDICDYVTPYYDERVLPNEFSYSMLRTQRARNRAGKLARIIEARNARANQLRRERGSAEMSRLKGDLLARRIPMTHWQSEFPKIRMVGYGLGMAGQWLIDDDFRLVSGIFGFNPLKPGKLEDRRPVTIKRTGLAVAGN